MSLRKTIVAVACGLVLAGGAGVGVLSAKPKGQPAGQPPGGATPAPAPLAGPQPEGKPQPAARPAVAATMNRLNARIDSIQALLEQASDRSRLIDSAKTAIRHYDSEINRLNARKASLQAQQESFDPKTEQAMAAAAKELAERLAANPEFTARTKLLAELWQEKVRADAAGKADAALARRLKDADDALAATKARLTAEHEKAKPDPREADAIRERTYLSVLVSIEKEMANNKANRRHLEESILTLRKELRAITSEQPEELLDELRRLRARKDALEFDGVPTTGRGDADTSAKLDALLAEVRELRRLVEAKQ